MIQTLPDGRDSNQPTIRHAATRKAWFLARERESNDHSPCEGFYLDAIGQTSDSVGEIIDRHIELPRLVYSRKECLDVLRACGFVRLARIGSSRTRGLPMLSSNMSINAKRGQERERERERERKGGRESDTCLSSRREKRFSISERDDGPL